jgi:oxaloacetate decarboxylase (Na+ extruding) subunit gamma
MELNLVVEAFKFMLLGMGTVFVFLILMIVAMNVQRAFVERCFPEDTSTTAATGGVSSAATTVSPSKKNKIAAIMGAICKHQSK